MKALKFLVILVVAYVVVVTLFESLLGYFQPEAPGTVVITTFGADGAAHDRVVSALGKRRQHVRRREPLAARLVPPPAGVSDGARHPGRRDRRNTPQWSSMVKSMTRWHETIRRASCSASSRGFRHGISCASTRSHRRSTRLSKPPTARSVARLRTARKTAPCWRTRASHSRRHLWANCAGSRRCRQRRGRASAMPPSSARHATRGPAPTRVSTPNPCSPRARIAYT